MTRTLLRGGYVHAPADPHATALAVEDGQVVWVGGDDAATHFADGAQRVVELDGRLVTPAFVDAHVHLAQSGLAAGALDLSTATGLAGALGALADHADRSRAAVILAFGWDETCWPEGRAFTRAEVDRATGGRAAFLSRVDAHSAVVSTAFLDACPGVAGAQGYDVSGVVTRDAHSAARSGLFRLVPAADRKAAIVLALRRAARQGVGMVHELGAPHIGPPEDFGVLGALRKAAGDRPALPATQWYWGSRDVSQARALGCVGAAGDLCVDGSIGSRTAALHAPYADADHSGHLYLFAEQVAEHVLACTGAGLQAGFHAIGDRAVTEVVAGFRSAAEVVGRPALVQARHRIEHVEMATAEQVAELAALGVTASVQPSFDACWGGTDGLYARRLGPARASSMNAFRSMTRAGVALAFGSDSPVTAMDPWAAVRAAAWHLNEDERIPVRAAFSAHTRGGWRAVGRDEGGVIAVGAPAGLAVWDVPGELVVSAPDARVAAWSTDPRAGVPRLPDLHPEKALPTCVLTLVDGEVAFEETGALT